MTENVRKWNEIIDKMLENRISGLEPKDKALEEKYCKELEELHPLLTAAERPRVRKIKPPQKASLIAHNNQGELIGFEDIY